jgi:hypothetical protein
MASNFKGHEPRSTPPNDERHESYPNLNLTQLVKHEESVGRKMHLQLEFEHITRPWHWRLGANAHSLILVLKIKPTMDGKPEILYEGIYQGDDATIPM